MRRVAVHDDGALYVPSAVAGTEMAVFLCASYDGTSAIIAGGHAYYPADWVYREFPEARPAIDRIRASVPGGHTVQ